MVTSTTTVEKEFDTDGVTTTIAYPYKFFAKSDIVIKEYNLTTGALLATKVLDTDYTIPSGSGEDVYPTGATITIIESPVPNNTRWVVTTEIDKGQPTDFPSTSSFPHTAAEQGLDKLTLKLQEVYRQLARTPQINRSVLTAAITALELPAPDDGKVLTWSGTAGKIISSTLAIADVDAAKIAAEAAQEAAEVAQTAAELAETNAAADAVSTAADVVSTAADVVLTGLDVIAAAASAASASAIANGDLFTFANTTGNFTAVNNGAYYVDDGAVITLPSYAVNTNFRYYCKTQPPVTGITLTYASTNIMGNAEDVLIKNGGVINVFGDTSEWKASIGSLSLLSNSADSTLTAKTGNYTMVESDDTILVTATGGDVTITTLAAASSTKKKTIKNATGSNSNVIIDGNASETIDGSATITIFPGQAVTIQSDTTNWILI